MVDRWTITILELPTKVDSAAGGNLLFLFGSSVTPLSKPSLLRRRTCGAAFEFVIPGSFENATPLTLSVLLSRASYDYVSRV